MPYVGTGLNFGGFTATIKDSFTGDGSATDFTLSRAPSNAFDIEVFVGNVRQNPNVAYTVSGTTLAFTGTPASGEVIYAVHQAGGGLTTVLPQSFLGVKDYTIGGNLNLNIDNSSALKFGADQDVTITHVADTGLLLKNTATADDKPFVLTLQTGETDIAVDDVLGSIRFQAPDEGTGTDALLVAAAIEAVSEGDFSASSNASKLSFKTGSSETATEKMALTSDGKLNLLTDAAVLQFGVDSDVRLTHVADTGLLLNASMQLQFNDASQNINAPSATVLDINATDEIELNATLIDINGNVEISGTATTTGVHTFTATPVFSSDITLSDDLNLTSDGAIITFGANSEIALTHVHDTGLLLTDSGGTPTLQLHNASESVSSDGSKLILTSNGVAFSLPTADGSANQVLATDGSGTLSFADSSANTPSSADGQALGSASLEWSDLFLADGGQVLFGNDQEITLTHDADVGLKLKHTATADDKPIVLTLQTGETDMAANDVMGAIRFQAPDEGTGTDAVLVAAAIQAVSEGDFSSSSNATRLEFHTGASEAASSKMTLSSAGLLTIADDLVIGDGKTIGSASDPDAITIASNGQLTLTQTLIGTALDISGDIDVDGTTNLDVVDIDGAVDMASTLQVDGAITSSVGATITTADNTSQLTLISTDADATAGPRLDLKRDSGSPADSDTLGRIRYLFDNDAAEQTEGVRLDAVLTDASNGTEDASFQIGTMVAGSMATTLTCSVGNVGIGTTTPAAILDMKSSGSTSTALRVLRSDANANLHALTEISGHGRLSIYDGSENEDIRLDSNGTSYISSGGNVGFGDEKSPDGTIHAKHNGTAQPAGYFEAINGSFTNDVVYVQTTKAANTNFRYFKANENGGSATSIQILGNGNVQNANNSYGSTSDRRIKQDITDANSQWDDIKSLSFKNYKEKYRVSVDGDSAPLLLGLVAQDLETAGMTGLVESMEPDLYQKETLGITDDVKAVKYSVLYLKAVKALQEAMTRIETLETEVQKLKDSS